MSLKHAINRNLFKIYSKVKYPMPAWQYFNRESVTKFNNHRPTLNSVQTKILNELHSCGIATTNLADLFPNENMLEKLQNYAKKQETDGSVNHKKKFLVDYWDERVKLDINNPFLKLALNPLILDVANTYMEMWTSLLYLTLQKTTPLKGELTNSQNWHRDPQEIKVVKVFTYLNDIDESSGPFTYVKNSAPTQNHKYAKLFPQELPAGSYPGNERVEKAIEKKDIYPMTGKAGTMIFCDTNGLHYGGVAKSNYRIMSTFGYAAHTYKESQMYYFDDKFLASISNLPKQSRHALRFEWKQPSA